MITIGLIGLALVVLICFITEYDDSFIGIASPFLCGIATLVVYFLSYTYSFDKPLEDYQRIENYSYVSETGAIETISGPFYKKDNTYYKQEAGKAIWIPFGECEFVEVNLPESNPESSKEFTPEEKN